MEHEGEEELCPCLLHKGPGVAGRRSFHCMHSPSVYHPLRYSTPPFKGGATEVEVTEDHLPRVRRLYRLSGHQHSSSYKLRVYDAANDY